MILLLNERPLCYAYEMRSFLENPWYMYSLFHLVCIITSIHIQM